MKFNRRNIFTCFIILLPLMNIAYGEKILGVTLEVAPYVTIVENTFRGFCVELLDYISNIVGIQYSLYIAPDKQYGVVTAYDRVTGMIGEVYNRAAEFAIADLTVTEERKRYVQFTEPFMTFGLSALIHKRNVGNMYSFEDLANQSVVKYGTYRSGRTINSFYKSTNKTINKMYFYMMKNQTFNLVVNESEAIRLVRSGRFAFIQESPANDYIASQDCDLTVIHDVKRHFTREYAIAMDMNSRFLDKFNYAIKLLKQNGTISALREKYWSGACNNSMMMYNTSQSFSIANTIIIIFLARLLLFY